jgi:penicillin-binding protein 2
MDSQELIEYTEQFGLGDASGIEIDEVVQGVPDPERKKRLIKYYLQVRLEEIIEDYFLPEVIANNQRREEIINTIVSWADYNPSRGSIINNLLAMETVDDYNKVSALADIIKYDYFNLMEWYEGDTLNFAIGQGDHQYTPVQMARYIAAIANGGKVLDLDVVKDNTVEVVNELNPQYIDDLRQGMLRVTTGDRGSARAVFRDFPIKVAGKTGTAEKEGRVPPLDEVAYLSEHLNQIDPALTIESVEEKTLALLIKRNNEIAALEDEKSNLQADGEENQEEIQRLDNEIQRLIQNGYINKGYVMRQAIKDLSEQRITDADINEYRSTYDNYSWFVSFAPYESPEIAVVILIPQGGSGGYSAPVAREIIGDYFGLEPEVQEDEVNESN